MIDVLYYMYYLFYLKVLKDTQPHGRTVWTLSFICSMFVISILDLILIFFFLYLMPVEYMYAIVLLILGVFYWIYLRKKRGKMVVEKMKPLIRGSFRLSVMFAILSFVMIFAMFLSSAVMGKYMYQLVEPMSRMVFGE